MPALAWERRARESAPAHAALVAWLELGPERTLARAAACVGKDEKVLRRWVRPYQWAERALAYDNHNLAVRQAAADRATSADARSWTERRDRVLEAKWEVSQRILAKANALLAAPVEEETVVEDRGGRAVSVTRAPVNDTQLKRAAETARLALELAQDAVDAASPAPAAWAPAPVEAGPGADDEVRRRAAEELEAWRSRQRLRVVQPPPAPATAPAETPPAAAGAG